MDVWAKFGLSDYIRISGFKFLIFDFCLLILGLKDPFPPRRAAQIKPGVVGEHCANP